MRPDQYTNQNAPGRFVRAPLAAAIAVLSLAIQVPASAADAETAKQPEKIEEVVVVGRLLSAAAQLEDERINDDVVSNLLGADEIGRVGDTTVAAALQRVSGLTLVNDKFIYVRGLGERYSSTTLNGAHVPSVDLSRNVIPLDLFPTSVVESIRVQKSYSAEQAAAFGGGNIDIRTKGLPDGFVAGIEGGIGQNTDAHGKMLTYAGGSDDNLGTDDGTRALPDELRREVALHQGDISTQALLSDLRAQSDPNATLADAQALNSQLASKLNRNLSVYGRKADPDRSVRAYLGNSFDLGHEFEAGFLLSGNYATKWREVTRKQANYRFPSERTDTDKESTYSVDVTGNANFGLRFADEQSVTFTKLFLRNTDDKTSRNVFFNENRQKSSGTGFENTNLRYEEREIDVNQFRGHHELGPATRTLIEDVLGDRVGAWIGPLPDGLAFDWFASESRARTDIPNEVRVVRDGLTDPVTGKAISMAVTGGPSSADFRFTNLNDRVDDAGWNVTLPLDTDWGPLQLEGGYQHTRQARRYEQIEFGLGPVVIGDRSFLSQPIGDVFSDASIFDPANVFEFSRSGANNQSYVAATMTDAWFGKVDYTWRDTWRVSAGVRWEDYRQVALDYNPFGSSIANPVITTDPAKLAQAAFAKDDLYPSITLTYMGNWLAETFQVRLGYSETVTRPDLREITAASYIDPLTSTIVSGNPGVTPASLKNWDARAEWYFSNGDNFSISPFYKKIDSPIEFFESPASDTNTAREIVNADSAEIYGVEFELLKRMAFLGDWADPFFVQANLTVQASELIAGPRANSPTHQKRDLANAAPFIANFQLGYDSPDGFHSATLVYNVFDKRLFVAGRNGAPDGFEQPFNSLDITYSYYPSERFTVKAKIQNILDESVRIERAGVKTFEESVGRTMALSLKYDI